MGYLEIDEQSNRPGKGSVAAAKGKGRRTRSPERAAAVMFAAEAEAAIGDLERRLPAGMGALERALAARLRSALEQLRACAAQIGEDGLMVVGSMGQQRAHPLLKLSADLRREIADGLKELTFRAEQGAMVERMNEASRASRRLSAQKLAEFADEVVAASVPQVTE
jgi:hypothetical protein